MKKGEMAESIYLEKKEESEGREKLEYKQVERMPSEIIQVGMNRGQGIVKKKEENKMFYSTA